MESALISRGRRAAAALAAAAALLWAFTRHKDAPPPAPPPEVPAATRAAPEAAPAKKPARAAAQPPKRRSALSDEGEALGGTPPKRDGGR